MPRPRFEIVVPQWRELDSGLLVPSSVADRIVIARDNAVEVPRELAGAPVPIAVLDQVPTSADQMGAAITERELGIEPPTDLPELVRKVQPLPFEMAFLLVAQIAAVVWHIREDGHGQLDLVRRFDMPNLVDELERALRPDGNGAPHVVFAEQYLTVLVRHAREATLADEATDPEMRATIAAYFAAASVASSADAHLHEGEPTPEEWLVYLVKNISYNVRSPQVNAFTRARQLFVELPARLVDDVHYCPIDAWFLEDYGLDAAEQHALGFSLFTVCEVLDDEIDPADRKVVVAPQFGDTPLADRVDAISELVSAPRHWYAGEFAAAGDELDAIAWERAPFLRRPFLRLDDGRWVLISPTAIDSWLGEGFYYRALECARRRGEAETNRFFTFFGKLLETYCLDLARSTYEGDRPVGGGRVHGEQRYGPGGGKRTSDIAIDLGLDLVLIEVVSARFAANVRVYGNPEILTTALERMLFKKMGQLGRVIAAILSGAATIPGIDPAHIERVWPIVVAGGDLMQTELLWDRIDEELPPELAAPRVEPLTVLDIGDLELLLGLIRDGQYLPDVLAEKAQGPYRRLDISRWMHEALRLPIPLVQRPRVLEERWDALGQSMRAILFPEAVE